MKLIPKNINGNILKALIKISKKIDTTDLAKLAKEKPNIAKLISGNLSGKDQVGIINALRNESTFARSPLYNDAINSVLGYGEIRSGFPTKHWINNSGQIRYGFKEEDLRKALSEGAEGLKGYTPKNISKSMKQARIKDLIDTAQIEKDKVVHNIPSSIKEDIVYPDQQRLNSLINRGHERYTELLTNDKIQNLDEYGIQRVKDFLETNPEAAKYFGIEDLSSLRKNFDDLKIAYTPNSYNKNIISGRNLFKELKLAGKTDTPVTYNQEKINAYYKNIVWPQIADNIRANGAYVPKETFMKLKYMFEHPTEGVDIGIGYTHPGSSGYSLGSNFIRFSSRDGQPTEGTIIHELHHSLRDRMANLLKGNNFAQSPKYDFGKLLSTDSNRAYRQKAKPEYFDNEKDIMKEIGEFSESQKKDLTPTSEIGATIAGNLKYDFWNNMREAIGRNPTREELYKAMDKFASQEMAKCFSGKAYGPWIMQEFVEKNPKLQKYASLLKNAASKDEYNQVLNAMVDANPEEFEKMGQGIKKGLKAIAGIAAPIGIGTATITDQFYNGGKLIKRKRDS